MMKGLDYIGPLKLLTYVAINNCYKQTTAIIIMVINLIIYINTIIAAVS